MTVTVDGTNGLIINSGGIQATLGTTTGVTLLTSTNQDIDITAAPGFKVNLGDTVFSGPIDLSGPLTLSGNPGTSGQVPISQGAGMPAIWASAPPSASVTGGATNSLLYQSAPSTTAFLGIGAVGNVLTVGAGPSLTWAAPGAASNMSGGVANDLLYQSAPGATAFLNIGTAGQVLTVSGGGTPSWAAPGAAANLAGGAANSIPYQSAPGTTTFLSAGTVGQVLTAGAGGVPSWVTPASPATQSANTVNAGPTTGAAAVPTFRSLVAADLASALVSPPAIGATTPNAGKFTNVEITGTLKDGTAAVGALGEVLSSTGASVAWITPNAGTVTSVTFTGDNVVYQTGPTAAVTTSGTLQPSLKSQNANLVFAGPATGAAAAPTFRSVVSDDLISALTTPPDIGGTTAANATFVNADLTTGTIATAPASALDIANKDYVDLYVQGLTSQSSVVAATVGPITLSGAQTIDTVNVSTGMLVLVKDQAAQVDNGVYEVQAGAWNRSTSMNTWSQFHAAFVFVESGAGVNSATGWVCTSPAAGTLGTTPVTFDQFSAAGSYTAGTGLTLTGTMFSVDPTYLPSYTGNLSGGNLTITGSLDANGSVGASGQVLTSQGVGLPSIWGNAASGTVTSVTYTGDNVVYQTGPTAAITTTGTLQPSLKNQNANNFFAGPSTGGAAAPTFRGIASADITVALTTPPAIGGTTPSTVKATTLTSTSLTATRVPYVGAGGLLSDDADMTFDGTSLTLANVLNAPSVNGATTFAVQTGGTDAITIDASQNVTIVNDALINTLTVGLGAGAVATNTAVGVSALAANTTGNYNAAIGNIALCKNTSGSFNVAVGNWTLSNNTIGAANTAVGQGALYGNTTGGNNTAVGIGALECNTNGCCNTANGAGALQSNTTGCYNTASGQAALQNNTTGCLNTASGQAALASNTNGDQNTALGAGALYSNTTGCYNTASGMNALRASTTGCSNTATGHEALTYNTTGSYNTATGQGALFSNTTGDQNTATGQTALAYNTTGCCNTAIGVAALYYNTTGCYNTATGQGALYSNTSGCYNTASGLGALYSNTTGSNNTASGLNALASNTTGFQNTATGQTALTYNTTGCYNTATGQGALYSNTTGSNNTATGLNALAYNTTGSQNTASGVGALASNTTGDNNVGVGFGALGGNTTGFNNIGIGLNAIGVHQTGAGNVVIGPNAGTGLTSGDDNTFVGGGAAIGLTTGSNNIVIGSGAGTSSATVSNEVTISNGVVAARFQGAAASWSFVSDARDKYDIEDLELGVDFLKAIKPRKFKWDIRDCDVAKGKEAAGFIAQEVLSVTEAFNAPYTGLVDTNNPEQYTLAASALIPMLVKAVQELAYRVEVLESK